jgi:crotonobetainyl-CoA:carnitine CoA-transferase CaiB-like acyl-CoA transferase
LNTGCAQSGVTGAGEGPNVKARPAPLAGITVLDFSQFLAGPVAALRLADLGARVIKIERPPGGDIGRQLAFAGASKDGDTISFHAMNRNKESLAADLKDDEDLSVVRRMISSADVMIENFRPGVMKRLGLDYDSSRELNPRIIYGSISGYGPEGPWAAKPGQDLLAQAVSGLPWASGSASGPPVAVGLSIADHLASCQLALGIAALLVRRERTGEGGIVETSLLEGVLDLQFELLTAFFTMPGFLTRRGGAYAANAYLGAPYGVYPTSDGYLALAMGSVPKIGSLVGLEALKGFSDPESWTAQRETIAGLLGSHLSRETTQHWLDLLEPADIWCAPVLTLNALAESEAFAALSMTQDVSRPPAEGAGPPVIVRTVRSPLRVDGGLLTAPTGAPRVGEHSAAIRAEFSHLEPETVATQPTGSLP